MEDVDRRNRAATDVQGQRVQPVSRTRLPVVTIARTVLAGFIMVDDEDEMQQSTVIKTHDAKSETSNSGKVRLGTLLLVDLHDLNRSMYTKIQNMMCIFHAKPTPHSRFGHPSVVKIRNQKCSFFHRKTQIAKYRFRRGETAAATVWGKFLATRSRRNRLPRTMLLLLNIEGQKCRGSGANPSYSVNNMSKRTKSAPDSAHNRTDGM